MRKIGILGLGEGRSVLTAAQTLDEWGITWICDLDSELLKATQQEYGIKNTTVHYSEMLQSTDLDTIMIYTPDPVHAEHITQAFRANKNVICTKPLVDSLDSGPALLEAQKNSGRELIVGQTSRFFPTFMKQHEDLSSGRHGSIVSCEAHYNGDKRLGSAGKRGKKGEVNWLYSGLAHPLDLIYWHLDPIESVTGMAILSPAGQRLGSRVPDCFHATLRSKSGSLGQISGIFGAAPTHAALHPMSGCTLRGDRGSSVATYPRFDYATSFDGETHNIINMPDDQGEYFPFGGAKYHVGEMRNLLRYFYNCLELGESPEPDLSDGLRIVAILKAIELSIKEKREVTIAEVLMASGLNELLTRQ